MKIIIYDVSCEVGYEKFSMHQSIFLEEKDWKNLFDCCHQNHFLCQLRMFVIYSDIIYTVCSFVTNYYFIANISSATV